MIVKGFLYITITIYSLSLRSVLANLFKMSSLLRTFDKSLSIAIIDNFENRYYFMVHRVAVCKSNVFSLLIINYDIIIFFCEECWPIWKLLKFIESFILFIFYVGMTNVVATSVVQACSVWLPWYRLKNTIQ
jgi:hypothetical protein